MFPLLLLLVTCNCFYPCYYLHDHYWQLHYFYNCNWLSFDFRNFFQTNHFFPHNILRQHIKNTSQCWKRSKTTFYYKCETTKTTLQCFIIPEFSIFIGTWLPYWWLASSEPNLTILQSHCFPGIDLEYTGETDHHTPPFLSTHLSPKKQNGVEKLGSF